MKGMKNDELYLEQFAMASTMALEIVPEQILIPLFLAFKFILDLLANSRELSPVWFIKKNVRRKEGKEKSQKAMFFENGFLFSIRKNIFKIKLLFHKTCSSQKLT